MAKKRKQPKNKALTKRTGAKRLSTKASSTRKAAKKTATKPKKTAKHAGKTAKTAANRREFRRYETTNLWVTELSGDYQFVVAAADLSEGGIFLNRRMKTLGEVSRLKLNLGAAGTIEISAQPVYDRLGKSSYGTGYRFTEISTSHAKVLRSFLRNLD